MYSISKVQTRLMAFKDKLKIDNIHSSQKVGWLAYKKGVPYDCSKGLQTVADIPPHILNGVCFEKSILADYTLTYSVEVGCL